MISNSNEFEEEKLEEIEFDNDIITSKPHDYIRINILSTQTNSPDQNWYNIHILDHLKSSCSKLLSIFRKTVDQREEISVSVPSRVHTHFIKRINFTAFLKLFKEWIKHPMNLALLIWLICVAISATMLALLLLGFLNKTFPTKYSRNRWIEINNQVLNALFTLMSLYQHPNLFHHLVLLFRWRSEDIVELRTIYSKNGAYKPREWAHMIIVVLLLHVTCFSQYVSCGLYWGYSSKFRPQFAQIFSFALGTIAPIVAGLYTVYSPLGKEFSSDVEHEEELQDIKVSKKDDILLNLEWNGGIFDCNDDKSTCFLSFFCTFCVFGWNMQRLGFGNMYVHMVTFFLLCVAPFWIFSISAMNISNDVIRDIVGILGLVLCVFGLIYGGFWRIKIREKFGMLGNNMNDYVRWIFCSSCSLAQEVRTVNFYDVEDYSLHMKDENSDEENCTFLVMDSNAEMMAPIQACIKSECACNDETAATASSLSSSLTQTEGGVLDTNQTVDI